MLINCLIVEDEPIAVEILTSYIENIPNLKLVATFHAAEPALTYLRDNDVKIHAIFMDINLPILSGIDMIKTIPIAPEVIFTTAYPEYAVNGFELEAVDYLVKPIAFERFHKAIDKLKDKLKGTEKSLHLPFKTNNRTYLIKPEDIHYIQSAGDYLKIFTKDNNLVVNGTMKEMEDVLHKLFLRIHKSYLVNQQQISYREGNTLKIADISLPIGAKYKQKVLTHINAE